MAINTPATTTPDSSFGENTITPLTLGGIEFQAVHIRTAKANILLIKLPAGQGFLGCGYFDLAAAERLNEPVAIVTGVKSPQDMLTAKVTRLSPAAAAKGVTLNMTGQQALLRMAAG